MAYAARHPEHIAHLMIVDSAAPKWDDTVFLFKDVFPEGMGRQQGVAFAEALGDSNAVDTDLREYFAMLFYSPENRDRFLAIAPTHTYQRDVNETLNTDLKRYDLNPELPKFLFPDTRGHGSLRHERRAVGGVEDPPGDSGLALSRLRAQRTLAVLRTARGVRHGDRGLPHGALSAP
jgi:pimeloyl-ACP methyl ester carboxylesterase